MAYRLGTITFLLAYLMVSLQIVIHVHVCQEAGVSIEFYSVEEKTCCSVDKQTHTHCHMEAHCGQDRPLAGCCETDEISLRVEQPQQLPFPLVLPIVQDAAYEAKEPVPDELLAQPLAHQEVAEPPPPKVARWRRHCADLTYG